MLDPYKMVGLNVALACILLFCVSFYTFVYPKKWPNLIILLLLISILPIISVFRVGVYESGDFTLHLYRSVDFYNSLREGNIFPSWASILNANYGYPLFLFINPLPYYLISLFHFLGFTLVSSMKIFLAGSYISSGLVLFLFAKRLFKNQTMAFISAIFYLFAPYHLIDQHFRVAVGEILIFTTMPLLLYASLIFVESKKLANAFFLSCSVALVIFSHQAMAVFAIPLTILFMIFIFWKDKVKPFIVGLYFLYFLIGILAASYTLLPYLLYGQFTYASSYKNVFFTPISDLLFSTYRYGFLYQGPEGQLTLSIGYFHVAALILGCLIAFFYKVVNNLKLFITFFTTISLILIIMLLQVSESIWLNVPLLSLMIMTSRIILFINLFTSLLAGVIVFVLFGKRLFISSIIMVLVIMSTSLNWGARAVISDISDTYIISQTPISSSVIEGWGIGVPIWKKPFGFENTIPPTQAQVINGSGRIELVNKSSTRHMYRTDSSTPLLIRDNTWYYPGWNAIIDGKKTRIIANKPGHEGKILIITPPGKHNLEVSYNDPPILLLFKSFTFIFTLLCLVIFSLKFVKIKKIL